MIPKHTIMIVKIYRTYIEPIYKNEHSVINLLVEYSSDKFLGSVHYNIVNPMVRDCEEIRKDQARK